MRFVIFLDDHGNFASHGPELNFGWRRHTLFLSYRNAEGTRTFSYIRSANFWLVAQLGDLRVTDSVVRWEASGYRRICEFEAGANARHKATEKALLRLVSQFDAGRDAGEVDPVTRSTVLLPLWDHDDRRNGRFDFINVSLFEQAPTQSKYECWEATCCS